MISTLYNQKEVWLFTSSNQILLQKATQNFLLLNLNNQKMRVLFVLIISLYFFFIGVSQEKHEPENRISYGFNFGPNMPNPEVVFIEERSAVTIITNKFGFSLGLLMNYKINPTFCFSPKTVLSFYNLPTEVKDRFAILDEYSVFPVVMEFKPHVKIKYPGKKTSFIFLQAQTGLSL